MGVEQTATVTPTHSTGKMAMPDGVELFSQEWTIPSPKAHVLIIHGYGEHSARYAGVAARLNAEGYNVYTYDQRGHGESPGRMGHVPSFDRLIDDAEVVREATQARAGEAPFFLFGHSMGGLVLGAYSIRYKPEVAGLVFSAGGLKADESVGPGTKIVARLLARVAPHVPVRELDVTGISRYEDEVTKYNEDPLVYHGKIGARTGNEFMNTVDSIQSRFGEITTPVLVMHGTADRLVGHGASRFFHERVGSADKTLKIYEGAYHEMFRDENADEFMADLIGWLDVHV